MDALDLAIKVRRLLTPRKAWVKGTFVTDSNGRTTDYEDGTCFCLSGAASKALLGEVGDTTRARNGLWKAMDVGSPIKFNDDPKTSHRDVLRKLDKAIAKLVKGLNTNE